MTAPPLDQQPLGQLLAALAADQPAPGSGAAAAVALALGAACAAKALTIAARRREGEPALEAAAAELRALAARALAAGHRDETAFPRLLQAEGQAARDDARDEIRRAAGAVLDIAARLSEIAAAQAPDLPADLAGDLTAAAALATAAETIARANLRQLDGRAAP